MKAAPAVSFTLSRILPLSAVAVRVDASTIEAMTGSVGCAMTASVAESCLLTPNVALWHRAAEAGGNPSVCNAGVIQTSIGALNAESPSNSMKPASGQYVRFFIPDIHKGNRSSVWCGVAEAHVGQVASARWRIPSLAISSLRIRSGRESTSAFRSERPYSGRVGSMQVGIVPYADIGLG
jgi:hypothetical protein